MLRPEDVEHLTCVECETSLTFHGHLRGGLLDQGELVCAGCGSSWDVDKGMPFLFDEESVRGTDRLMRTLYNTFHRVHNPAVTYVLPLLEFGTERSLRDGYMEKLALGSLTGSEPVRILETGIGAGANLSLMRRDLPPGIEVEIWGIDLSRGMLQVCRREAEKLGEDSLRLLMADAHHLPFPADFFDRVFHVGGIGGFNDPPRALAEMARVAKPGTPIVVVDEQLDRARWNTIYHKMMFKLLTFYDSNPHCPVEALPKGASEVSSGQVSRFYYCLSFKKS